MSVDLAFKIGILHVGDSTFPDLFLIHHHHHPNKVARRIGITALRAHSDQKQPKKKLRIRMSRIGISRIFVDYTVHIPHVNSAEIRLNTARREILTPARESHLCRYPGLSSFIIIIIIIIIFNRP